MGLGLSSRGDSEDSERKYDRIRMRLRMKEESNKVNKRRKDRTGLD